MKNSIIILLVALAGLSISSGCGKLKKPTTANITVVCSPLPGKTVDVSNLKAELHGTATFDNLKYHFDVKGTAASSTGTMKEIAPGRYFLVVWKDLDASNTFSKDDIFGFYPTALDLVAGDEKNLTVQMYIVE